MKKPFSTIIAAGVLAFGAAAVFAQAPPAGGPPDPQARMAQLAKDLSLTDAQKGPFQEILTQERTDLMSAMKQEREQNTEPAAAHANHQKIEDVAMGKLKPILSDEQFKKYQAIVEAEAYARHHRAAGSSAPAASH